MGRIIVGYLSTLVAFGALDAGYIGLFAGKLFKDTLGDVMAAKFVIPAAVAFYLIFPVGLMIFALLPALNEGRWQTALFNGAMIGFFAYATYDLTNYATIRNWTATITITDLCWGAIVSGLSTTFAFFVARATVG